jgi:hypothetical protein
VVFFLLKIGFVQKLLSEIPKHQWDFHLKGCLIAFTKCAEGIAWR